MWQRFTERARKVVFYAQEEAQKFGEGYYSLCRQEQHHLQNSEQHGQNDKERQPVHPPVASNAVQPCRRFTCQSEMIDGNRTRNREVPGI